MLIDSHAHLDDDAFDADREAAIDRAREAGVGLIINVGFNEARWATTLALATTQPAIYAVLGLHPHEAQAWDGAVAERLRERLRHPRVVGLGEIGLDFYRDYAPHDQQRVAFRAQLRTRSECDLPVVLHSRAAEEETVATLAEARDHDRGAAFILRVAGSGGTGARARSAHLPDRAGQLPEGGAPTRSGAADPARPLLLETDCPYLAPQARRGKRNEPCLPPLHGGGDRDSARGDDRRDHRGDDREHDRTLRLAAVTPHGRRWPSTQR